MAADLDVHSAEEARRRLAELQLRESRCNKLRRKATDVSREVDDSAGAHQRICGPLQVKLKVLDQEIVNALTSSGPVEVLENQRSTILDQIEQATLALAEKSRVLNDRLRLLQTELDSPKLSTSARPGLESKLFDFAPVELLAKHEALQNTGNLAQTRARNLQPKLTHLESSLEKAKATQPGRPQMLGRHESDEEIRVLARRLARAKAEAAEASRVAGEAGNLQRECYRQIMAG
jgi:hypothetical protein